MLKNCVPFKRKTLYLSLTIPILVVFIVIAIYLWSISIIPFIIYTSLFLLVTLLQSYCCAHGGCPYLGEFCPGFGGFTVLSSKIGYLLRCAKKNKRLFNLFEKMALAGLVSIAIFPVFFIYKLGIIIIIGYLIIIISYLMAFFMLICPHCALRDTCPGGQIVEKIIKKNKIV